MRQLFVIRKSVGAAALAAALILSTIASGDASKISSLRIEPHFAAAMHGPGDIPPGQGALPGYEDEPARLVVVFLCGAARFLTAVFLVLFRVAGFAAAAGSGAGIASRAVPVPVSSITRFWAAFARCSAAPG